MISMAECLCAECNDCGQRIGYETTAEEAANVAKREDWFVYDDDYYMICTECIERRLSNA